jgi:membrane protease YdiL (CAAX protease family)
MSFLAAAGWTLVAVLFFYFTLSVADSLRAGAQKDVVTQATCCALAYSLTLFVILRVHEPEGSIRNVLALKMPPLLTIPLAVIAGAGLAAPAAWLNQVMLARFPYSDAEKEQLETFVGGSSYDTTPKKIALVVVMVFLMPLLDELFFRGALFTPLRKRARLEPVIMATAAYETLSSSSHVRVMFSLLALSLALSWIRGMSGSSIPAILARMAFFAPQFVSTAMGKDLPPLSKGMLAGSAGAAVASLAMIGLLSRGRAPAEHVSDT